MVNFTDAKDIILALKKVYNEKNLSIDKTLALVNEKVGDGAVSRSTIQAVFAQGSENGSRQFGYDTILKPLCIALLDIETIEQDDSEDVKAYKAILKLKKEIIEELKSANEHTKVVYADKLQEETEQFQKSLDFIKHQVELKDQRIDDLLTMNKDLMQTNNRLINQLMDCPLRKEC